MPIENPFIKPDDYYIRRITPVKDYLDQAAWYLSKQRDIPYDIAHSFIKKVVTEKKYPKIKDPVVQYLHREENGDRVAKTTTLTSYIRDSVKERNIIAPTLTTYISDTKKKSVLATFIEANITRRNIAKKAMFAFAAKGDKTGEMNEDGKQTHYLILAAILP